jgi:RHH-type proline utilization regulon transcriptional repressor/proline dehydrogenase/delta 1-pyrroline-5-carboxylate dehydrogenase
MPDTLPALDWNALDAGKYADEEREAIPALLADPPLDEASRAAVLAEARAIVRRARGLGRRKGVVESFLEEFSLSTQEGFALMCLAEALLRTPDAETVDRLIAEKIGVGEWQAHLGQSDNWLVNASTWGLMLTGRLVELGSETRGDVGSFLRRLVARSSEPVVRAAVAQAMRIMGEQFVLGRTVDAALRRGAGMVRAGDAAHFSIDMLGEGARTAADARRYLAAYADCIDTVASASGQGAPEDRTGVSVKLSALHPRYDARQRARVMDELYPDVLALCQRAAAAGIGLCLDAEEADRLVLSLEILERLTREPTLSEWTGLGLAVQAYQKRARGVITLLEQLAVRTGRRLMVRLVKGAYWDGEIKRAQQQGSPDYPVWTTKAATDVAYLSCARALIGASPRLYPQFATHNAHTVAAVRRMAEAAGARIEFQRLHGMGEQLYASVEPRVPVRVYAPVGAHEDLLPYLVRRLLENGANTSFVHASIDEAVPVEQVATDPITTLQAAPRRHPRIAPPPLRFGLSRRNSAGRDLSLAAHRAALSAAVARLDAQRLAAVPIIAGRTEPGGGGVVSAPADRSHAIGTVRDATEADIAAAMASAVTGWKTWNARGGIERARILRHAADLLEARTDDFVALLAREAARTFPDGVDEVREAVDFLRYYASDAERLFGEPLVLPGPVGETNTMTMHGRGVFAAIAPWNFPLAIFIGQAAAALAAGNAVLAKPAPQTPLVGFEAVRLLHEAGIPPDALHFLPGDGAVGAAITRLPGLAGVAFTGSTTTAQAINRTLAAKDGPIPVLIAETGGLNAMVIDSSALVEQVVDDALLSAFGSAGQRCSALRVLMVPRETAAMVIERLSGAMAELALGDPVRVETDVGPLIDARAVAAMQAHLDALVAGGARLVARFESRHPMPARADFFAPAIVELPSLDLLVREPFGPILHVIGYDARGLPALLGELSGRGYGLTLGIHTRLDGFVTMVRQAVSAGNVYVNRSMIGAVVGVQPFGGHGLSGTGPKAGGPNYVARFAAETVMTENIAAKGGDPSLFTL